MSKEWTLYIVHLIFIIIIGCIKLFHAIQKLSNNLFRKYCKECTDSAVCINCKNHDNKEIKNMKKELLRYKKREKKLWKIIEILLRI